MEVPFVDLRGQYRALQAELDEAIRGVMERADFALGKDVAAFEEEFAVFSETEYAVGVDSGLSALELSLRALGIGPGDEVIVPANTFIATAAAVTFTGAEPVLVDVDGASYNIDVEQIEEAIGPRTKAIIPVHLYGQPAEMDRIMDLAERHGLVVVEDACQAHGARYKGRRTGSLGHAAAFSFYPTKNLGGAGDGGMVTTNDAQVAAMVRAMRNVGQKEKYYHELLPFNHRLDTLQAAILRVKLRYLDGWTEARRNCAAVYDDALGRVARSETSHSRSEAGHSGSETGAGVPAWGGWLDQRSATAGQRPGPARRLAGGEAVIAPAASPDSTHVYHLYVVRVPGGNEGSSNRDALQAFLRERGIGTAIHYPVPIHQQPFYADKQFSQARFPVTEQLAGEILSLPMFPEMTAEQARYVAERVHEGLARIGG